MDLEPKIIVHCNESIASMMSWGGGGGAEKIRGSSVQSTAARRDKKNPSVLNGNAHINSLKHGLLYQCLEVSVPSLEASLGGRHSSKINVKGVLMALSPNDMKST